MLCFAFAVFLLVGLAPEIQDPWVLLLRLRKGQPLLEGQVCVPSFGRGGGEEKVAALPGNDPERAKIFHSS